MKVPPIYGRKVCTFRLEPTELEELERTASIARYISNWGLACCHVKLRRGQRQLSRARQGSRNRQKTRRRVAPIQKRTAKLRQEFSHQLSHLFVMTWSVICFADLSLKALARTKPAKSWLDAACGELLRQVAYKALWNRKHLVPVHRFFPSTKLCSECGSKNDELSLSARVWTGCRTHHLRDWNAAKNVRAEGLRIVAEGHPETQNACGLRVRLTEASIAGLKPERIPHLQAGECQKPERQKMIARLGQWVADPGDRFPIPEN